MKSANPMPSFSSTLTRRLGTQKLSICFHLGNGDFHQHYQCAIAHAPNHVTSE